MGMFSSLFGSSGSDKADKFRQQALDAFNAIRTPELSALQIQLENYVNAGRITPEQAEAELLNSNAFNAVKTDPALIGAQKAALSRLQEVGSEGGLTAIDRAKLQAIRDQQEQQNRSDSEAIMANARARGVGNSNLALTNRLIAQQAGADRAAKAGTDVAADAEARALQALVSSGQLAGQMDERQFGQQVQKAAAQNAIDAFNANSKNDVERFNVANNLAAQQANLANAQHVADANAATHNAEKQYNAQQNETIFNNEMAKAAGKAGTLNQWANDATAQARNEKAADMSLTGGLLNAGATLGGYALAGPVGGAAAGAFSPRNPTEDAFNNAYVRGYAHGGVVEDPEKDFDTFMASCSPKDFSKGGKVPGTAPVSGNSPANDIVPAYLSPGEVVIPRTEVSRIETAWAPEEMSDMFDDYKAKHPTMSDDNIWKMVLQTPDTKGMPPKQGEDKTNQPKEEKDLLINKVLTALAAVRG